MESRVLIIVVKYIIMSYTGNIRKKRGIYMQEYTKDRLYDIMDTTQCNQANMLKRLDKKSKFGNFVMVYYSIALIVYALTAIYFPNYYDETLSGYFSIIISVVILAFSIINGNSKYSERIRATESTLNAIKALKRELTDSNIETKNAEYNKIIDTMEYRAEVDFFNTLKQRCKEYDIRWYRYKKDIKEKKSRVSKEQEEKLNKLNNYLSEDYPFIQQLKIIFDGVLCGVIVIMPILIFMSCFYIKM